MNDNELRDITPFIPGADAVGQLGSDDIAEGFDPEITEGNKNWILLVLGFKPIGKGVWQHDTLGFQINFSLQTENIPAITKKIFAAASQMKHDQMVETLVLMFNITDKSGNMVGNMVGAKVVDMTDSPKVVA